MSIRTEKVASSIKKVLASGLNSLASEFSAGLVTITAVRMSNDLQIAKVYISSYGGKIPTIEFINLLEHNKKNLKTAVASNLRLRHTPDLKFFIDDTLEQMEHIRKLLDSVKPTHNSDDVA